MIRELFQTINYTQGSRFNMLGCKVEIFGDISEEDIYEIIKTKREDNLRTSFRRIGIGSHAEVYSYGKYAIKKIDCPYDKKNSNDIEAFMNLRNNPNIPELYAIIDDDVIVMEKINGVTLNEYVDEVVRGSFIDGVEINKEFYDKFKDMLISIIEMGYSPHDLHDSNVMIDVDRNRPVAIDLGWFFKHERTFNSKDDMKNEDNYVTAMHWSGSVIERLIREYDKRKVVV